ncbi:MAG TPA: DUF423 domain-containing protein [Luteibaculaceae bacterium]|nr:DUF423 domain-containing protein [Luteibaculaceae bacterium]
MKKQAAWACIHLAVAIILGALGAHALKAKLDPSSLESFKTGVEYHIYHGLALLILSNSRWFKKLPYRRLSLILLHCGILLFSGSIYLLSTQSVSGLAFSFLGPVTPVGGLLLIGNWILIAFQLFFRKI